MHSSKPETGLMEKFKMPAGTSIGHVELQVSNLSGSLKFYQEILGFKVLDKTEDIAHLGTADGGNPLIILFENKLATPKPFQTAGLFHVAVRVPSRQELGKVLKQLVEAGKRLQGAANHGVSEALYLADPDGNGLEFYYDLPENQWPWEGNEVKMITIPLDLKNLLDVAGGGIWAGLHEKTDIGHIHLRVSELNSAGRFYHEILGFDITQSSYPGALFLSAGRYHHHIGLNTWAGVGIERPPSDAVGLLNYSIIIPGKENYNILKEIFLNNKCKVKTDIEWELITSDQDKNKVLIRFR